MNIGNRAGINEKPKASIEGNKPNDNVQLPSNKEDTVMKNCPKDFR